MGTSAFSGRWYLEQGSSGSPVSYTRSCNISTVGGLGETNSLIDVTTNCSTAREYIAGLPDGAEFTVGGFFIVDDAIRRQMIADVKNRTNRDYRIVIDDNGDGSTDLTFWFRVVPLSWTFEPNEAGSDEANRISYTFKITGGIDITEP